MSLAMPPPWRGLSARLLLLTIGFVMLAEVLIFAPSVGRFRLDWLEQRLAAGHLAILALEATPDNMVSAELEAELLAHVGAYAVALKTEDGRSLMLMAETPRSVDATYDLTRAGPFAMVGDALMALLPGHSDRLLRVIGVSPQDPSARVEVVIDEGPLMYDLIDYALRILGLSLVISLITAGLVYYALHWLIVRPMRRITESMVAFRAAPETTPLAWARAYRSDEIGIAERELGEMQAGLREALRQRARLAALGTAVSKISHDLRNILATARLVSDRLAESPDPEVQRLAPSVLRSIDRAADLCERTLTFAREGAPPVEPKRFLLADLVAEVGAGLPASLAGGITWVANLPHDLAVEADRAQLFRALANLAQNAVQAGATRLAVTARAENQGHWWLTLADNGPGLSPRAREHLFEPFTGAGRAGGTGLGLAIARELVEAHGGSLSLVDTGPGGTTFRIEMPAVVVPAPAVASRAPASAP